MVDFAYLHSYHKKTSNDSYVPSDVIEEIKKSQLLFNVSYLFWLNRFYYYLELEAQLD